MKIQMLGICRFSLLSDGGFKTVHDSVGDRRRHLYDPLRLEQRFLWFERIALPGWLAQTDPDYRLVIAVGEDFPQMDRLRDITARARQIVIEAMPYGRHREICRRAMLRHADAEADRLVLFRHDDDDAVAVDYVARTRADILRHRTMAEDHPLFSLDYPTGFTLEAERGDVRLNSQITQNLGVALGIVAPVGHGLGALDYPHHKIAAFMPGLCLPGPIMYVRGKHGGNDSDAPRRGGSPFPVAEGSEDALMAERFAIDLPAFRAAVAGQGRC